MAVKPFLYTIYKSWLYCLTCTVKKKKKASNFTAINQYREFLSLINKSQNWGKKNRERQLKIHYIKG